MTSGHETSSQLRSLKKLFELNDRLIEVGSILAPKVHTEPIRKWG